MRKRNVGLDFTPPHTDHVIPPAHAQPTN